uniref:Uncharacterized protein n=1 Tax=Anguilla anguilla TaxID=7936 RepID=A0A0E9WQV7_ANGAN
MYVNKLYIQQYMHKYSWLQLIYFLIHLVCFHMYLRKNSLHFRINILSHATFSLGVIYVMLDIFAKETKKMTSAVTILLYLCVFM